MYTTLLSPLWKLGPLVTNYKHFKFKFERGYLQLFQYVLLLQLSNVSSRGVAFYIYGQGFSGRHQGSRTLFSRLVVEGDILNPWEGLCTVMDLSISHFTLNMLQW